MPRNIESRLAYDDCYELFDKALETDKGIRVRMRDEGEAWDYRLRLYCARTVDRKDNRIERKKDDPLYSRSVYDPLVVRVRTEKGETWLYIEKRNTRDLEIQDIANGHSVEIEQSEPIAVTPPQRRI